MSMMTNAVLSLLKFPSNGNLYGEALTNVMIEVLFTVSFTSVLDLRVFLSLNLGSEILNEKSRAASDWSGFMPKSRHYIEVPNFVPVPLPGKIPGSPGRRSQKHRT
jgi:hypothetical protein